MDTREVNALARDPEHAEQEVFTPHVPRTLVVRKGSSGGVFLSISEGSNRSSVYLWPDEVARLADTVMRDGYQELNLSY